MPYKKAFRLAERAMVRAINRRDAVCQVRLVFPAHQCSGPMQIDHCLSRRHLSIFFDPRNLTRICQGAHFKKTYQMNGYDKLVNKAVELREGPGIIDTLIELSHKIHKYYTGELLIIAEEFDKMWLPNTSMGEFDAKDTKDASQEPENGGEGK
jgi:hypothetical protein